ncbi:M20 family metallopeptidase [Brevibacillus humidisoli]|uniref:M20 family metallopeptidase n=1 Tax=Brevibacillus humidisoli TaxID=2895522 RepID=UPI001E321954|nr:M20 family metallopeptidase [Brevibacillus humidisoli]UFJ41146.1 M20 family metallopeptidase [Brevibacillus humidisoli]
MSVQTNMQEKMHQFLQLLEQSVNVDSPSRDKRQGDQMAEWYARQFVQLTDGRVERIANPTYGDQLRCTVGSGDKQILLIGHYDTVWPLGESARRPFRVEDGKAYGPGVYDMKAGVLQAMYALHLLLLADRLPMDKKVVLLLNSDEEIGSPSSRSLIEQEARGSAAVFVLEPPAEPGGALKTWRKGSAHYRLRVQGISAHAGVDHGKGVSAIEELAGQIKYLHSLTDYEIGTTVNVGLIKGGIGANVVADQAEAEIDVRMKTTEEASRLEALMAKLQPTLAGTKLTVSGGIRRPPMQRTEQIAGLYLLAKSIAADQLGFELAESGTGGVSDGNFAAACGAPTLDGLGARGGYAHSPNEFIYLDEVPKRTALLAGLVEQC